MAARRMSLAARFAAMRRHIRRHARPGQQIAPERCKSHLASRETPQRSETAFPLVRYVSVSVAVVLLLAKLPTLSVYATVMVYVPTPEPFGIEQLADAMPFTTLPEQVDGEPAFEVKLNVT